MRAVAAEFWKGCLQSSEQSKPRFCVRNHRNNESNFRALGRKHAQLFSLPILTSFQPRSATMCPTAAASGEISPVPTTDGPAPAEFQAVDAHAPSAPEAAAKKNTFDPNNNPYSSRASDFLSNVSCTISRAVGERRQHFSATKKRAINQEAAAAGIQ